MDLLLIQWLHYTIIHIKVWRCLQLTCGGYEPNIYILVVGSQHRRLHGLFNDINQLPRSVLCWHTDCPRWSFSEQPSWWPSRWWRRRPWRVPCCSNRYVFVPPLASHWSWRSHRTTWTQSYRDDASPKKKKNLKNKFYQHFARITLTIMEGMINRLGCGTTHLVDGGGTLSLHLMTQCTLLLIRWIVLLVFFLSSSFNCLHRCEEDWYDYIFYI